jgi:heme exporter protein D
LDGIAAFLDMGGRAQFVWPAYGLTAVALVGLLIISLRTARAQKRDLGELDRRPRRRRAERKP